MGTGTALALQLLIVAIQNAQQLTTLLATAAAEGRDVSDAELAGHRQLASDALDKLAALPKAPETAPGAKS